MLPSFARQTVTVLTAQTINDHGHVISDWSVPPIETPVAGCSFQPGGGVDDLMNRDGTEQTGVLYMPAGTAIDSSQRVRVGAKDYEVDGDPEDWQIGVGTVDHVLVRLKRWRG